MRAFIASILLFFYALTSTGATVYMHQCHGTKVFLWEEEIESHHANCAMCLEHHQEQEDATCHQSHDGECDHTTTDCCKDIVLDLKKSQEEVESAPTLLSFLSISPATLTIFWIVAFHADIEITEPTGIP